MAVTGEKTPSGIFANFAAKTRELIGCILYATRRNGSRIKSIL